MRVYNLFTTSNNDAGLTEHVERYLAAAAKLKEWQILVSVSYNCLQEETFLFFSDSYSKHQDKEGEVLENLETALAFIKTRERPWRLLYFCATETDKQTKKRMDMELKFFGKSANVIRLYEGLR